MVEEMAKKQGELVQKSIQVRFVGDRTQIPSSVLEACVALEQATHAGSAVVVQILFCYGARQELLNAVRCIATAVAEGSLSVDAITEQIIAANLWTDKDIPDPDLILRTGYVQRLSNFLLYQAAYAELYFVPCLWPDITDSHLQDAIVYFDGCKRNFGQ
jgi:undecaprenyl diphosphate synthase